MIHTTTTTKVVTALTFVVTFFAVCHLDSPVTQLLVGLGIGAAMGVLNVAGHYIYECLNPEE